MKVEFLDEQAYPVKNEEKVERVKDSLESISAMLTCIRVKLGELARASKTCANALIELEDLQKQLAENIEILNEVA